MFENQRRIAVLGIGKAFTHKDLLPSDRHQWSNEHGTKQYGHAEELSSIESSLLPSGAEWAPDGTWEWDDRWSHAFNFGLNPLGESYTWTPHAALTDSVRRRKWTRQFMMIQELEPEPEQSLSIRPPDGMGGEPEPQPLAPAKVWPRIEPRAADVARLTKTLSKWGWVETGRSILVFVDNRTSHTLRLHSARCEAGTFVVGFEPPDVIRPNEMIVFGNKSKSMWEAEGDMNYMTDYPVGHQDHGEVNFKWKVPLVTESGRGNWSHCRSQGSLQLGIEGGDGPLKAGAEPYNGSPTQANDAQVKYVVFDVA